MLISYQLTYKNPTELRKSYKLTMFNYIQSYKILIDTLISCL
nr:MAG TPA: hypothetical protein [Crassvirales sp.]